MRTLVAAMLCAVSTALLAQAADAQRRQVYDAMDGYRRAAVSSADRALLRRDVHPVARRV